MRNQPIRLVGCADLNFSLIADFAEPFLQLFRPLALVGEAVAESPTVSADGIDVHRGGYLVGEQCLEVAQTVGRWHGLVVG